LHRKFREIPLKWELGADKPSIGCGYETPSIAYNFPETFDRPSLAYLVEVRQCVKNVRQIVQYISGITNDLAIRRPIVSLIANFRSIFTAIFYTFERRI